MAAVGIVTMHTYLMIKKVSEYTKLIDITDFPNLGGEPERVDVTTLSHTSRVYTSGVQDQEAMTFTANYTKENYAALKEFIGKESDFALWFGADSSGKPDGHDGKKEFKAEMNVYINGGGVNEAIKMTISLTPTTEMKDAE